jgi:hypothetical protein
MMAHKPGSIKKQSLQPRWIKPGPSKMGKKGSPIVNPIIGDMPSMEVAVISSRRHKWRKHTPNRRG